MTSPDYEDIASIFGTMEDMEELIAEGHKRKIQNHYGLGRLTIPPDEHAWFIEARENPDSQAGFPYIWQDEPNGIISAFSGSTLGVRWSLRSILPA